MAEARGVKRPRSPRDEDRRMWRLLLARLHPDAGGDDDLFAFACAVRDGSRGAKPSVRAAKRDDHAALFLGAWRHTMGRWASGNRDALRRPRTGI